MICREFPLLYSAQVDGQATEAEKVILQRHLRECSACRGQAAEMRTLRAELRSLAPPRPIRTLAGEIQIALRQEAQAQATRATRRADWIDAWRTRLFTQGIGMAISMCLFFLVTIGVFRPAYRTLALMQDVEPPPPPVFMPQHSLLNMGASLIENEEIIATLAVRRNGTALVTQMVAPSNDPSLMAKFSNVVAQEASFQPTRPNRDTIRAAVVILGTMNIRASI